MTTRLSVMITLLASFAFGQVSVKLTPVNTAITDTIGKTRGLQYYEVDMCLASTASAPRVLSYSQIQVATTVPLISTNIAKTIIGAHLARTGWGLVAHDVAIIAEFVALAVSIAHGFTGVISTDLVEGLSVGALALTGVGQIADMNLASATALYTQLNYPITLTPNSCVTDYEFGSGYMGKKAPPTAVQIVIP